MVPPTLRMYQHAIHFHQHWCKNSEVHLTNRVANHDLPSHSFLLGLWDSPWLESGRHVFLARLLCVREQVCVQQDLWVINWNIHSRVCHQTQWHHIPLEGIISQCWLPHPWPLFSVGPLLCPFVGSRTDRQSVLALNFWTHISKLTSLLKNTQTFITS